MKMSKFQLIVLGSCIVFLIGGVIAFSTFKSSGPSNQIAAVSVWGVLPKPIIDKYVSKINLTLATPITVNYTEKSAATIGQDFVSALARGSGPDILLIPSEMLVPNEDKLTPIPYSVLPQSTFMNSYIDEARIYLGTSGVYGVPFITDPLVMYWNRDMFNAAGIPLPPTYWDELGSLVKKLTVKTDNGTITQSAVAMGDFANVDNAREILGSLILQSGNPITAYSSQLGLSSTLSTSITSQNIQPALDFFTGFVDPNNTEYSWNHSWPDSKTAFLSGKLGIYFGMASELNDIRAKNPNLNFDVAALPQLRKGGVKATYGQIYALSIARASQNSSSAYQTIAIMTQPQYMADLSNSLYLPSVSRTVIAAGFSDPYLSLFDQQSLIAKTWLDAGQDASTQVFSDMVQSFVSGQKSDSEAIQDADRQYGVLLRQASGQTAN